MIVNDAWKNRNENKQSISRSHFFPLALREYMIARERHDGRKTTTTKTPTTSTQKQTNKQKRKQKKVGEN